MPSRRSRLAALALAGAAGYLSYLAFRPFGWWFAAPAAMGLLYLALRRAGLWRGLASALLFGLGQFLPMLTWALNAAGWLPYLALSLLSALLLALGGALYRCARFLCRSSSPSVPDAALFALSFTAADAFRQFFPYGGFPWGRLGFSQVDGPMARWAWLGGVPLVGLAAALAGALAVVALAGLFGRLGAARGGRAPAGGAGRPDRRAAGAGAGESGRERARPRAPGRMRPPGPGPGWRTAAGATGLGLLVVLGPLAAPVGAGAETGQIRVGAVQGDVAVTDEGLFARQREVLENHVRVSRDLAAWVAANPGAGPLDIVLWPENATDIDPRVDQAAYDSIDQAAAELGAPLLIGAAQYVNRNNRYNQGLLWRAGLGVVDVYSKRHPAPFAEYMPARSFFRLFTDKVDLINSDMLAGSEVGLMRFEAVSLGRQVALGDIICFEVAYDSIVADVVRAGAELIVVQTNNASFGRSEESTQQLAMTRLRAIEHGRTTVQISTVGVSGAVAPDGSMLTEQTGLFEAAHFVAEVPLRTSITPATRIGELVCRALMIGPAGLAVAGLGARLARSRPSPRAPRPRA
ncbi:MAG: apolipoprotein N-acyltransferase [Bifidobacteriaceae bacterium]|jgi:apolipoprotein N-acyltransferase|nr:apolipoprotein N-acyltransferase [Bifidobacteriaceae bacterium]